MPRQAGLKLVESLNNRLQFARLPNGIQRSLPKRIGA